MECPNLISRVFSILVIYKLRVYFTIEWVLISMKCWILQYRVRLKKLFKCQFKVLYYNILILHTFIGYGECILFFPFFCCCCCCSYLKTLSIETVLVFISHVFLTQKFRDWVIWREKNPKAWWMFSRVLYNMKNTS